MQQGGTQTGNNTVNNSSTSNVIQNSNTNLQNKIPENDD
jgi:hypothetical protein